MKTHHILTALGVLALAGLVWAGAPLLAGHFAGGPPRSWEELAERHDADGDGRVSAEELVRTSDHFSRLDPDGDGYVTEAEFEAHRGAMAFTFVAQLPGSGLGLHLVQRVAAAHGGRVEVESAPGRGATFTTGCWA